MICGDLHIHSSFSFDSCLEPSKIVQKALKKGLSFVAVTDHGTIQGGIEATKAAVGTNITVIVGTEIKTEKGDIVGLFLKGEIQSKISIEVINEIHWHGGLAILPHPFKKELKYSNCELYHFDAIEINARMDEQRNQKARILAQELGKPLIAGSDAHFSWEVGNALNYVLSTSSLKELLMGNAVKTEVVTSSYFNVLLSYSLGKLKTIPGKLLTGKLRVQERT